MGRAGIRETNAKKANAKLLATAFAARFVLGPPAAADGSDPVHSPFKPLFGEQSQFAGSAGACFNDDDDDDGHDDDDDDGDD